MIKHPSHASFNDFAIVKILGKTYICPGWHEVPNGTTRDDVKLEESATISRKKATQVSSDQSTGPKLFRVLSSKGDKKYIVTLNTRGEWDCDCPARQFRRGDCKHIKKIKANETITA